MDKTRIALLTLLASALAFGAGYLMGTYPPKPKVPGMAIFDLSREDSCLGHTGGYVQVKLREIAKRNEGIARADRPRRSPRGNRLFAQSLGRLPLAPPPAFAGDRGPRRTARALRAAHGRTSRQAGG